MAFILRSSKLVCNFLGYARRANLTSRREKVLLLDYDNFIKFKDVQRRAVATAPKRAVTDFYEIDKNLNNLHNNLKADMVDLRVVEKIFFALREKGTITSPQLTLLLRCCGNAAYKDSEERRIKMAKSIWETAKRLGTEIDISHYNNLLGVFVENSCKISPDDMLSEIQNIGLEPNRVTYRRLLKAYCQQGNIQGAGNLLESLKQKSFPISEYDFCSLIQGHCEAGQIEEATKILGVMKEKGITPSLEPYIFLLCGYAKQGQIQEMEKLLDEINNLGLRMTDSYLLNLVYTLIVNNKGEHVDTVLKRMKGSMDNNKTLMRVVHRLLHKHKDEEAFKLFGLLNNMGYSRGFLTTQSNSIIDHYLYNRSPSDVTAVCERIQNEGWSSLAYSHALKKAILTMELDFCAQLMHQFKRNNFPIRTHYFWPLIVRYSEQGNEGVISVLKVMKTMFSSLCFNTVRVFIKNNFEFSGNWKADIEFLKRFGAKECHLSLIGLSECLSRGNLQSAEKIASSYGIFKPQRQVLKLLVNCFATSCLHEEERFVNTLYCLAHDCYVYKSHSSPDAADAEEDAELSELNSFFGEAFTLLMSDCPKDVFFSVLQNASKKKVIIPQETASVIREKFPDSEIDGLLKEFTDSDEFELDKELLKLKSENAIIVSKQEDRHGLIQLASTNDLRAEEVWKSLDSKPTIDEHLAMFFMYAKLKMFDKAFDIAEGLKTFTESFKEDAVRQKTFRVSLHLLHNSGNVEKMLETYETGIRLKLIDEGYTLPIIRTIFNSFEADVAIKKCLPLLKKIKHVGGYLTVMQFLIPSKQTEIIQELTENLATETNEHVAVTALFTAYMANKSYEEARELLEKKPINFQYSVFLIWLRNEMKGSEKPFEDVISILKCLGPVDRTPVYRYLLSLLVRKRDTEKIKALWLQCQEDNITDPYFLEHLRHAANEETASKSAEFSNRRLWFDDNQVAQIRDQLRANRYSDETFEKLMSGRLPGRIAHQMLPILAAEGKSYELVTVLNKYRLWRFVPEVASKMLQTNKIEEFLEFVNVQVSMKKYSAVCNALFSEQARILQLAKEDEEFFEKVLGLSIRCYEEGSFETLVMFSAKLCLGLSGKTSKAEELLSIGDGRILSQFRNSVLGNIMLGSTEDMNLCKNILESEKIKSAFSGSLECFYDKLIKFYVDKGDIESALSYLEKAKEDKVEGKLNKELMSTVKEKLENKGSSFPYPELLQEAA